MLQPNRMLPGGFDVFEVKLLANRLDWQHKGTPAMLPQEKLIVR
jgi:hypothetical protein